MVDDHILIRNAIASVVNTYENCNVDCLAANGKEFIEKIKGGNIPDLVILDLNMPSLDGFETAAWLQANHPNIKVLVLTMFDSELTMIRLLRSGVRGMVKKDIHPEELEKAIHMILDNGFYFNNFLSGKSPFSYSTNKYGAAQQSQIQLSETEITFLKLNCSDMTYKEIAQQMGLSPRTIDSYRDNLFEKLNVKSRVGLAIYAVKSGIIDMH